MATTPQPTVHTATGLIVPDTRSVAEAKWEKATTLPMIFLSFVFLLGFSVLILDDQKMYVGFDGIILVTLVGIWIAFIVDYVARFILANNKAHFVRRNLLDLLSVFVPFFRPFLLLVYLGRLPWFRGRQGSSVRARLLVYAASISILFIYVIALAVYAAERSAPGATIVSFGDAVWWAAETVSTVGYGDMVPVTIMGRLYAGLLMLGGMVIVGATTGTIVSYLAEQVQNAHKRAQASTHPAQGTHSSSESEHTGHEHPQS
jgi:voltage-gated potassium channel